MLEGREAEAAAVAARLKAFQANPVRMARLYADGAEPLPEGAIVLRFAQGRIPAALAPSAWQRIAWRKPSASRAVDGAPKFIWLQRVLDVP